MYICCRMFKFTKRCMDYVITTKKLGNNWYLDIIHDNPTAIMFNKKISRFFSQVDVYNEGILQIYLTECHSIIPDNTIFINDLDILRYFTTSDNIDIRFSVYDHEFCISSDMYYLLEQNFNPNFHKYTYTIEISNRTI